MVLYFDTDCWMNLSNFDWLEINFNPKLLPGKNTPDLIKFLLTRHLVLKKATCYIRHYTKHE